MIRKLENQNLAIIRKRKQSILEMETKKKTSLNRIKWLKCSKKNSLKNYGRASQSSWIYTHLR